MQTKIVTVVNKDEQIQQASRWFKLMQMDEFSDLREYIINRVTSLDHKIETEGKTPCLDSALKVQALLATKLELTTILKHFSYMASEYARLKEN